MDIVEGFWEEWSKADELTRLDLVDSLKITLPSTTLINSYLTDLYNYVKAESDARLELLIRMTRKCKKLQEELNKIKNPPRYL